MTTDDPQTFHGGVFSDEIADGRCGVTIHLPPEGVRELLLGSSGAKHRGSHSRRLRSAIMSVSGRPVPQIWWLAPFFFAKVLRLVARPRAPATGSHRVCHGQRERLRRLRVRESLESDRRRVVAARCRILLVVFPGPEEHLDLPENDRVYVLTDIDLEQEPFEVGRVFELDRRPPVSFPQKRSSPAQFNFIEPEAYPGTPFTETNHA